MTIRVHSYVNDVCKSCGAVKNNDHIGPSWCSGRPTARAEANTLREQVERLTRERDEARANYAFMVERAADQRLDGYRELGARAAAAENNADKLATQLDEALESLEGLEAHIREHLPYTYDDGEDDDANPEECVEYAAREIRELKRDRDEALAFLRECHRELATIEAITVSPSDTDGLLNLVRRVGAALEVK
jgi:hypothetical protein